MDPGQTGRQGGGVNPAPGSDLERLVELEDRIAGELARAESEAAAIIAEAGRTAAAAAEREAGFVESELAALRERVEGECGRQIEEIGREAGRQAERLDRAGVEKVDRLAARVVERITTPVDPEAEEWNEADDDHQDVQGAHPGAAGKAS